MIDGLVYGSACGFLLIAAVAIGALLNRLFGPGHPSITGGPIIGQRLSDRSIEYWHSQHAGTYDRDTRKAGRWQSMIPNLEPSAEQIVRARRALVDNLPRIIDLFGPVFADDMIALAAASQLPEVTE